jgi:hypothetical protein
MVRSNGNARERVAIPVVSDAPSSDECLEFVRFCYRRRRVSWPELYDEMCAVAARGTFKGLGYAELPEHGICFSLSELPRLASLTERVMLEDRPTHEPAPMEHRPAATLTIAAARG